MTVNVKERKLVQLLAFTAKKEPENTITKLKAIKLVWAADRYHLRKYGRLVSGDEYYAMRYGPVASRLKDIAEEDSFLPTAYVKYSRGFISPDKDKLNLTALNDVDYDLLSETDIEALEFAWNTFGDKNGFEIADISHRYPEWTKFENVINSGQVASEKISLVDLFDNPENETDDPFKADEQYLADAKSILVQSQEVADALAA